jgi:hypothetical protein
MTHKQRKYWYKKAIEAEQRLFDFRRRHPDWSEPDGSFVMSVVLRAFAAAKREAKREASA